MNGKIASSADFLLDGSLNTHFDTNDITRAVLGVYATISGTAEVGLVLKGIEEFGFMRATELYNSGLLSSELSMIDAKPLGVLNDLEKLQNLADQAAANVKAMGNAVFTQKQLQAINRNPNLRAAYQGTAIDTEFKRLIAADKDLSSNYSITKQGKWGPDLINKNTNEWVDITTVKQIKAHFNKYDPFFGKGMGYVVTY